MTTASVPASSPVIVTSFYKFVDLAAPRALGAALGAYARELDLLGTLLLAEEGLNASIAGSPAAIATFLAFLRAQPGFKTLNDVRESIHTEAPFRRLKIKYKREIVSLGVAGIAPARATGIPVAPSEWHALLDDPEVLLLDTRNSYEHEVGTFEGSVDLGMRNFREFPALVEAELARRDVRRIAMFCTGGIRCEKASAYLLQRGYGEIYQLAGGILRYLEETPPESSRWQGECFVFDARVALDADLNIGEHSLCFACRRPLSAADRASPHYSHAQSCAHCYEHLNDEQRRGFAERRRQVALAAARSEAHIGAIMPVREPDPSEPA
jgi:UPF0176 protein